MAGSSSMARSTGMDSPAVDFRVTSATICDPCGTLSYGRNEKHPSQTAIKRTSAGRQPQGRRNYSMVYDTRTATRETNEKTAEWETFTGMILHASLDANAFEGLRRLGDHRLVRE